jgi:2-polyprenyl-3-methyl-5-hydroxy-6-metoxy-1,4-benzoquinol methylase
MKEFLSKATEILEQIRDQSKKGQLTFILQCLSSVDYYRYSHIIEEVLKFCPPRSSVVDAGAAPFIISSALNLLGYSVIALDAEPESYSELVTLYKLNCVKLDLEKDRIPLNDESVDCIVFTEVLEHLHPYYIKFTFSELNRILKKEGFIIMTTPNIASLYRRLSLLAGIQPQYVYHVREYTRKEVEHILSTMGFKIVYDKYACKDSTFAENLFSGKISLRNAIKTLIYPLVKINPSLRTTLLFVGKKMKTIDYQGKIVRWG